MGPETPMKTSLDSTRAISRRRFLGAALVFVVSATLASVLIPIVGFLWPPKKGAGAMGGRVQVGTTDELPVGRGQIVSLNNKPVIVANTDKGGIKAFSAICTHLGCIVKWDEGRQIIHCPCHDGFFNPVNGTVISGPPPSPLPPIPVAVEGGKIFIGSA